MVNLVLPTRKLASHSEEEPIICQGTNSDHCRDVESIDEFTSLIGPNNRLLVVAGSQPWHLTWNQQD
jgi:hypothetical protein